MPSIILRNAALMAEPRWEFEGKEDWGPEVEKEGQEKWQQFEDKDWGGSRPQDLLSRVIPGGWMEEKQGGQGVGREEIGEDTGQYGAGGSSLELEGREGRREDTVQQGEGYVGRREGVVKPGAVAKYRTEDSHQSGQIGVIVSSKENDWRTKKRPDARYLEHGGRARSRRRPAQVPQRLMWVEGRRRGGQVDARRIGGQVEGRRMGGQVEGRRRGGQVEGRRRGGKARITRQFRGLGGRRQKLAKSLPQLVQSKSPFIRHSLPSSSSLVSRPSLSKVSANLKEHTRVYKDPGLLPQRSFPSFWSAPPSKTRDHSNYLPHGSPQPYQRRPHSSVPSPLPTHHFPPPPVPSLPDHMAARPSLFPGPHAARPPPAIQRRNPAPSPPPPHPAAGPGPAVNPWGQYTGVQGATGGLHQGSVICYCHNI